MEHLGQRNKSHHFLFSTLLFLFNPTRPLPRYIFQLSPYPKIGTSPFATSDDLFYYLVDLLAATVYWNPHRSEIMRRATRPDARVTKRIIIGNEMNYRELKESVKKKEREKKIYRKQSTADLSFSRQHKWILLFRVIGAYRTAGCVSQLFFRWIDVSWSRRWRSRATVSLVASIYWTFRDIRVGKLDKIMQNCCTRGIRDARVLPLNSILLIRMHT